VESQTQALNRREPQRAPSRILVVEDDANSREGLRGLLAAGGHQVETAADGWQAIERIKQDRYALAIVDLDLPVVHGIAVDGWDVARILRAFHPGIAILLVSARGGEEVERAARQLGLSFLEKPLDVAGLRLALTRLVPQGAG